MLALFALVAIASTAVPQARRRQPLANAANSESRVGL